MYLYINVYANFHEKNETFSIEMIMKAELIFTDSFSTLTVEHGPEEQIRYLFDDN